MKEEKWFVRNKKADFMANAKKFNIHPVIARLIRNRDITEDADIQMFLYGGIEDMYQPALMKNLDLAADIITEAIKNGQKIRVVSDYDVDGCMSCVILVKAIKNLGGDVDFDIPDRVLDGYGINERIVRCAYEDKVELILTCDNGIAAFDAASLSDELGITFIVTDHHEIPFEEKEGEIIYSFPKADVIVDPKMEDDTYPFKELCGGGVAFKLAQLLYEKGGKSKEEAYEFIEFAAIATVCDVVSLVSENRIIVKEGIKRLKETKNKGLLALFDACRINTDRLSAYHLGFVIGPSINAAGRLSSAKKAVNLFFEEDYDKAFQMAKALRDKNTQRKDLTAKGLEDALYIIESTSLKDKDVIMVYLKDCHESVSGIIAGRLREIYYKPIIVASDSGELIKCSGRSIENYNMFAELSAVKENFEHFGGHPMAAGLSFKREKFHTIRKALEENSRLTKEDLTEKIHIDVPLKMKDITPHFIKQLELMEPCGVGNEKACFAEKNVSLLGMRILGENKNAAKLRMKDDTGRCYDGIYFGDTEGFTSFLKEKIGEEEVFNLMSGYPANGTIDIIYFPEINEYKGMRTLQISIKNFR